MCLNGGIMISIVTPVYNEDGNVVYFHDEVTKVMQTLDMDYEIIYVNDGSKDRTDELIHQLAAGDPHVRALTFAQIGRASCRERV